MTAEGIDLWVTAFERQMYVEDGHAPISPGIVEMEGSESDGLFLWDRHGATNIRATMKRWWTHYESRMRDPFREGQSFFEVLGFPEDMTITRLKGRS